VKIAGFMLLALGGSDVVAGSATVTEVIASGSERL
jgi:hypothetical protein